MYRACARASGHGAPNSIQLFNTASCPTESLSFSFGGIAGQFSSYARVAAKYNGLANGLRGATAGSSLSPPFNIAAREVRSNSPLTLFASPPWQAKHLPLRISRTFSANKRSPSGLPSAQAEVEPAKTNRKIAATLIRSSCHLSCLQELFQDLQLEILEVDDHPRVMKLKLNHAILKTFSLWKVLSEFT